MHLKTCLLLGVSAALTSTVIAVDPTITFCEDWEATLNCETQKMELGKCKLIPDSNKKGDTGSRGQTHNVPGRVLCRFYENDQECSPKYGRRDTWADFDNNGGSLFGFANNARSIKYTYRHYECLPFDGNYLKLGINNEVDRIVNGK